MEASVCKTKMTNARIDADCFVSLFRPIRLATARTLMRNVKTTKVVCVPDHFQSSLGNSIATQAHLIFKLIPSLSQETRIDTARLWIRAQLAAEQENVRFGATVVIQVSETKATMQDGYTKTRS